MNNFEIYYDDLQEGMWFKNLLPAFNNSKLVPITGAINKNPKLAGVLKYDRADIILVHNGEPILVLERTIEVPSGHNVGQRFGRIVGAAEENIPSVYFFPYKAFKHGGKTAGPRYSNLRLFYALDILIQKTGTAITAINWPVDEDCKIIQLPSKDLKMKQYLELFLDYYNKNGMRGINNYILNSNFQSSQYEEVHLFSESLKRKTVYDTPPKSLEIIPSQDFNSLYGNLIDSKMYDAVVLYKVGMKGIRSDPYTGTAMLYDYLYIKGVKDENRTLILHFPHITVDNWNQLSSSNRKDIKLFKAVSDGILFKDAFLNKHQL